VSRKFTREESEVNSGDDDSSGVMLAARLLVHFFARLYRKYFRDRVK
jgi:hypothetical protein